MEQALTEAEGGVDTWEEKVKVLREKEEKRLLDEEDEEEDEFAEGTMDLSQARATLEG